MGGCRGLGRIGGVDLAKNCLRVVVSGSVWETSSELRTY